MKTWDSMQSQKRMFLSDPVLIHVFGFAEATILCRILYKMIEAEDWVEATHYHIWEMTGISEKVQRRAIGNLKKAGLLEVRENRMHHQTSYRVNRSRLNEMEEQILAVVAEWNARDKVERDALLADLTKGKFANRPYPPYLPTGRRSTPNGNLATLPTGSSTLYGTELEQEKESTQNVDSDESTPSLEDSESASPEAPEPTPQAEAAAPPRRAPRMPPPRPNAPESFETRRDCDALLCPTEGIKTLPPKPREQRESLEATVDDVINAWNEMAETCGLAQVRDSKGAVAGTIRVRLREKLFAAKWREGIELVPTEPSRYSNPPGKWHANMKWFLRPGTLGEILDEAERMQRTAAASSPGPATAPKPKSKFPVGSKEWEKEQMSR